MTSERTNAGQKGCMAGGSVEGPTTLVSGDWQRVRPSEGSGNCCCCSMTARMTGASGQ